jgi:glycosyltransferase involved in cell wall biosynthesis
MAMGLPIVSTSVGAEGLDIHPGQDILIANDASSFAGEVLRLFAHADLRARLSEGGRRLAARYDWNELMRPFADLVDATARQRGGEGH